MKAQIKIISHADSVMDKVHGDKYRVAAVYVPEKSLCFWPRKGKIQLYEITADNTSHVQECPTVAEVDIDDNLANSIEWLLRKQASITDEVHQFCTKIDTDRLRDDFLRAEREKMEADSDVIKQLMQRGPKPVLWTAGMIARHTNLSPSYVEIVLHTFSDTFRLTGMSARNWEDIYTLATTKKKWRKRLAEVFGI